MPGSSGMRTGAGPSNHASLALRASLFITGSAAEVTPVSEIGEHIYKPSDISQYMVDDYSNLVRGVKV